MKKLVRKANSWVVLEAGKPKRRFATEMAARAYLREDDKPQIIPQMFVEEDNEIDFGEPFEQED